MLEALGCVTIIFIASIIITSIICLAALLPIK